VILIYPISLYIILISQREYDPTFITAVSSLLFFVIIIMILFKLLKAKKEEKKLIAGKEPIEKTVELCIVGKNEGQNIIETLKHYLDFPAFFSITVYDDHSDDGSYEKMLKLKEKYSDRLKVKRLKRSEKTLHPKGMGVESFIGKTDADILLINDADTLISLNHFKKALIFLIKSEYDVVHLSRRNDFSNALATRISDTEEITNTSLKLFGINQWCFPGSGILMKKEAAKILQYSDFVPGDDLEMGRQLKAGEKEIYHFQTLFAHEKAPMNFKDFFSQRAKWCRNIAYHLLENEKNGSYIQVMGSSFTLFFLFGLSSPLSLAIIFTGVAYTLLSLFSKMIFAQCCFHEAFFPAVLNTFQLWVQGAVFTPFYLLLYLHKKNQMTYTKSKV